MAEQTAVLPTPAELAQEEQSLFAAAEHFERTGEMPTEAPASGEQKKDDDAASSTEGTEQKDEKSADVDAAPKADDKASEKTVKGKSDSEPDQSQKGKDSKQSKDEARREKSWQALNEQKEALRKEREAIEAQRRELEQQRAQNQPRSQADDYEDIARDFEKEGKTDLAQMARDQAANIRRQEAQQAQAAKQNDFRSKWDSNVAKAVDADPDLDEADSPLHKEVAAILKAKPVLSTYPEGILDAVWAAKLKLESASASDLRKTVEDQKKQIDELNRKLSIGGSLPTQAPAGEKSFEQMNEKEQEEFLRRQAESLDSRG